MLDIENINQKLRPIKLQESVNGQVSAPSNIAFVKYWGKKDFQKPLNPSLSSTLKNSKTDNHFEILPGRGKLFYQFSEKKEFSNKMESIFEIIKKTFPIFQTIDIKVDSKNNFPHSSGIASSASSAAAFSKALTSFIKEYLEESEYNKLVSFIARMISGSGARSTQSGWMSWGDESEDFASLVNQKIGSEFKNLHNSIFIVDAQEKKVSSRFGHELMNSHIFCENKIKAAKNNYYKFIQALNQNQWDDIYKISKWEALALHAMMMTSSQPFTLLRPKSLELISLVEEITKSTHARCFWTFDAGPNMHLITHPEDFSKFGSLKENIEVIEDKLDF